MFTKNFKISYFTLLHFVLQSLLCSDITSTFSTDMHFPQLAFPSHEGAPPEKSYAKT